MKTIAHRHLWAALAVAAVAVVAAGPVFRAANAQEAPAAPAIAWRTDLAAARAEALAAGKPLFIVFRCET